MIPQTGRVAETIQAFFYHLQRRMPTEWASWIGSYGIRKNARMNRPEIIEGAKRNLRRHRPEASDAEIDAWVDEFLDGVGRVAGEFAVMHRFLDEGRIETTGLEAFRAAAGRQPILALCVHTGNWETFGPMFQKIGVPLASFYAPPDDGFEREVAEVSRTRFGVQLLRPDSRGARDGLRLLRQNRVVMIFPDEARRGVTMAPLFGRAPHAKGNLAVAARLARMTGASLAVVHCRRIGACRFHLTFGELFNLPPGEGKPDILADVAFLNARIEPVILENIPRWYFLDDAIVSLES